jgi:hypothetical protein
MTISKVELKKQLQKLGLKVQGNHIKKKDIVHLLGVKSDTITTIDFRQPLSKIKNFAELPTNVQEFIKSADHIESRGFQELIGFSKENKILWSAGGHWDGQRNTPTEKFVVENFGGGKCPHCKNTVQWSNR